MERIRAKKSLGQNFLVDRNILGRIVETAEIGPDDRVLEIGPGKGALTDLLAEAAGKVVAVELDDRLVTLLGERFPPGGKVEIVRGDVLRTDLRRIVEGGGGRWKVVANLPYNISSQVIFRFIDERALFTDLVLMLQREVGERLVAPPSCKDYGIMSVFCRLHFDVTRAFPVRPGAFRPVPKVDSVVLKFRVLPQPRVDVGNEPLFRAVVKGSFGQRRKTLWNCLKGSPLLPDEGALALALEESGIDPSRRGETLSLDEFAKLSRVLGRVAGGAKKNDRTTSSV